MGIDDIQLSPELIAALYPETLVSVNDLVAAGIIVKTALPEKSPVTLYPYLGKNLRSIIFLVDYPDQEFIPENQLAFLRKILAACKCSLDDIALVNTSTCQVQLNELITQLHPRFIFLWGVVPAMTTRFQGLQDLTVSDIDGISIVPVLKANIMNTDNEKGPELKQQLWACLKKLFNL